MAEWTNENIDIVISVLFESISYPMSCNEIVSKKFSNQLLKLVEEKGGYGKRELSAILALIKNALAYITNGQYNFGIGSDKLHKVIDKYKFVCNSFTKLISTKK
jgi:hypothetical protein